MLTSKRFRIVQLAAFRAVTSWSRLGRYQLRIAASLQLRLRQD